MILLLIRNYQKSWMNWKWQVAQFSEIKWWRNYLKSKLPEDYLFQKKKYWEGIVKKLNISFGNQDKILDAGCGPAGIFIVLEDFQVDGVDPLIDAYDNELVHFSKDDYPKTQFFNQRIEAYQKPVFYDKIFCWNAINHVANIHVAFDQLVANAKMEGEIIVSIDVHKYAFLKQVFRWIPLDILHPHQYQLKEYMVMIENRGCQIKLIHKLKSGVIFDYFAIIAKKI